MKKRGILKFSFDMHMLSVDNDDNDDDGWMDLIGVREGDESIVVLTAMCYVVVIG